MSRKLYPGERPPNWNGVPDRPTNKVLRNILIAVGVVVWGTIVFFAASSNTKSMAEKDAAAASSGADAGQVNPDSPKSDDATHVQTTIAKPQSKWTYSKDTDEMRGITVRYASVEAENTISLDFPYGEQRGEMVVRQSEKSGLDIMVGVPNGQILCHSFMNSHINVKFDDGPIQRFGCNGASDGTSNMVFIKGASGFLAKLKQSGKVIVEAEFYQNGMQQMTFDTANLEWE